MHELLGQRPRALVRSYLYLAQSKTTSCWLRSLVGVEVRRCRSHSMAWRAGGRICCCSLGRCGGQLRPCCCTFNMANTLNHLTWWLHRSLHHIPLASCCQRGVRKCGVAPLSTQGVSQLGVIQTALGFGEARTDHEWKSEEGFLPKIQPVQLLCCWDNGRSRFHMLPVPNRQALVSFSVHGCVVLLFWLCPPSNKEPERWILLPLTPTRMGSYATACKNIDALCMQGIDFLYTPVDRRETR